MGVGDARQNDELGSDDEVARPRADEPLDVRRRPRRDDEAARHRDRVDPTEAALAGQRGDPAPDDQRRLGGHPIGSANSARSPASSRPAPRPTASATRAFGPVSHPAWIAPARTHCAPPPGNA